jgi:RNA polymerase sigma-70 factor (ECF subfamily)
MTEDQFDELRPSAFAIAYRMVGSVREAEDVVQEGYLRLHRARVGGGRIESPRACAPVAWIGTVSASLLPRHGCKSATDPDRTSMGACSSSRPGARSATTNSLLVARTAAANSVSAMPEPRLPLVVSSGRARESA